MEYTAVQHEILDICTFAHKQGASDIHIQPETDFVAVRIRINGVTKEIRQVPKDRKDIFLKSAYTLFSLNLNKVKEIQDGRFEHPDLPVDYRISTIATHDGARLCLRLLERDKTFHLDNYSLDENPKKILKSLLLKGSGLILITGPTGSGKSTLLYSILGAIDRSKKTVFTVEDPVEYQLPGASQIPITGKLSFSDAEKALMRQDPDVMMIGEIRDLETAKACINFSSSGHLVLSTLHANDVLNVFQRLSNKNVNVKELQSVLCFASAQRLEPKLCEHCKEEDLRSYSKELINEKYPAEEVNLYLSIGCESCNFTGIGGRILFFEYGMPHENTREMVIKNSLKNDAIKALRKGEIDAITAYKFS